MNILMSRKKEIRLKKINPTQRKICLCCKKHKNEDEAIKEGDYPEEPEMDEEDVGQKGNSDIKKQIVSEKIAPETQSNQQAIE